MGYTTHFNGQVEITPQLNKEEIKYLKAFSDSRRMDRECGEYYVDGNGLRGQDRDIDVIDQNNPPKGQPSLWCQWRPSEDGNYIEWDGGEKFYDPAEWMKYIIDHFLKPDSVAKLKTERCQAGCSNCEIRYKCWTTRENKYKVNLPFLQDHNCNGEIYCDGEDSEDNWMITVENNEVFIRQGEIVYGEPEPVEW